MDVAQRLVAAGTFESPGPHDFVFKGALGPINKPMLIVIVATVLIAGFMYITARNAQRVPGKLQFAGESLYGFVRNSIALDAIGKEGIRYVPYLATLFFFLAACNIAGIVPFAQIPATSRIAFPLFLALVSGILFNIVGIRRLGGWRYVKTTIVPPGVPWPVLLILTPIEAFSTFIVRPLTLCLRLTFNMFAGHLVLLLFILGGDFLVFHKGGPVGIVAGSISLLGSLVLTFFEGFIQLLQAYVFTLLSALYIGGALADEH